MHCSFWYSGKKTKYASFYEAVTLDVLEYWLDGRALVYVKILIRDVKSVVDQLWLYKQGISKLYLFEAYR